GPSVRDYNIVEGRFLKAGDSSAAVLTSNLADALGLKLGDTLRLPTPEGVTKLTIVGLRPGRGLVGSEEVLVALSEAQKLLSRPGAVAGWSGAWPGAGILAQRGRDGLAGAHLQTVPEHPDRRADHPARHDRAVHRPGCGRDAPGGTAARAERESRDADRGAAAV